MTATPATSSGIVRTVEPEGRALTWVLERGASEAPTSTVFWLRSVTPAPLPTPLYSSWPQVYWLAQRVIRGWASVEPAAVMVWPDPAGQLAVDGLFDENQPRAAPAPTTATTMITIATTA